jgi:hypothetical protein
VKGLERESEILRKASKIKRRLTSHQKNRKRFLEKKTKSKRPFRIIHKGKLKREKVPS